MSNVWILTIGGSDVRLKSNKNWNSLRSAALDFLKPDREFKPEPENTLIGIKFILPSRVLGTVYGSVIDQNFQDLDFPLLDNFLQKFNDEEVALEKVFIFLTDQEEFFAQDSKLKSCHFWNDTSALKPIISEYLKQRLNISVENQDFRILKPKGTTEGLDDWNAVLNIVQEEISELPIHPESTIYVSHQAGTPAMSSAVQFVCLTRFGKQVNFLLGSERNANSTKFIESSTYLYQLQIQQAKILLDRPDYFGVKELLGTTGIEEIDRLLEIAIFWNLAQFNKFSSNLKESSNSKISNAQIQDESNWWLPAYEAAYLGVVRLEQENVHEAMFHSFRALEGLAAKYPNNKEDQELCGRNLFGWIEKQKRLEWDSHEYIKKLILVNSYQPSKDQTRNDLLDSRNSLFHDFSGITKDDLFNAWNVANSQEWNKVVCSCLNFISGQTFSTLEEASIMPTVHKELVAAIASLAQSSN
jgi:hypothetical protein